MVDDDYHGYTAQWFCGEMLEMTFGIAPLKKVKAFLLHDKTPKRILQNLFSTFFVAAGVLF